MQTIFVTGAEGFAGSHLVQYLRQRGYDVVAGVRNRARKLAFDRQNGKAIVCDVSDAINVARAVASVKPDGVIHLGGISRADEAAAEPLSAYQSIVSAWANVLDAVRRATPRARVLMISACDVYGTSGNDGNRLSETTRCQPTTTFGSLKAAAEAIAQTYFQNYHLNVTVARPFAYVGPGQPETTFFGSVATKLARWDATIHGDELRLPDLQTRRDVLHVDDLVTAYERLLRDGKPNETYNVCSGRSETCRDIVQHMIQCAGVGVRLADAPPPADEGRWAAMCGDNSKICNELNWQPTRSAQQAAEELVQSCKSQRPAPVHA